MTGPVSVTKRQATGVDLLDLEEARRVVRIAADTLDRLADRLDPVLVDAAAMLHDRPGRMLLTGIGKSAIVARKIAATMNSLGISAQCLHASDALHGDLGAMTADDALIAISISGATHEVGEVMRHAQMVGAPTVGMTARRGSPIANGADYCLFLPPVADEGYGDVPAPMASILAAMALGDALAVLLARASNTGRADMALNHPGGTIGQRLRPVSALMLGELRLPLVPGDADVRTVIDSIGAGGFGLVGVIDPVSGALLGAVTDGDLRRAHPVDPAARAMAIAHCPALTLTPDADVEQALQMMRANRVTALFVVDPGTGRPVGLVQLHDLLAVGTLAP
ncbi:SIS domain-containing protein [Sphingomonas sp. CJ99]